MKKGLSLLLALLMLFAAAAAPFAIIFDGGIGSFFEALFSIFNLMRQS